MTAETLVNGRSEEHTSELQSHSDLVCRLLLESSSSLPYLHSFPTRRSSDLAHLKCRQFRFELVFLDGVNDAVHGSSFRGRSISADARQTQVPSSRAVL